MKVAVPSTVTAAYPPQFVGMADTADGNGYWLVQAGGGVFSYGNVHFYGSLPGLGIVPAAQIVGIVATPDGKGYWLVGADGGVFSFGDARFFGSIGSQSLNQPIAGLARTPDGGCVLGGCVRRKCLRFRRRTLVWILWTATRPADHGAGLHAGRRRLPGS